MRCCHARGGSALADEGHGTGGELLAAGDAACSLKAGGAADSPIAGRAFGATSQAANESPLVAGGTAISLITQGEGDDADAGEESEATTSGSCGAEGDNVTWSFNAETGELVITGEGAMAD